MKIYKITEASEYLGVSINTLRRKKRKLKSMHGTQNTILKTMKDRLTAFVLKKRTEAVMAQQITIDWKAMYEVLQECNAALEQRCKELEELLARINDGFAAEAIIEQEGKKGEGDGRQKHSTP